MQTSSVTTGTRARSGPLRTLRSLLAASALLLAAACGGSKSSPAPAPGPTGPSNLAYANVQATVGQAISVTPTVTGTVTTYSITPDLPAPLTLDGASGVLAGTPAAEQAPTTYTVTAANNTGSTTATFTLSAAVAGAPVISRFGPAQTRVAAGVPTLLSWSLADPASVTSVSIDPGIGTVTGRTWVKVSPDVTTRYTLTARNAAGQAWSVASLTVTGPVTYRNTFSAAPSMQAHEGSAHLLGDSKVVMTQGDTPATWIYDLPSRQLSPGPATSILHLGGASVVLPDGRHVLIFGGEDNSGGASNGVDQLTLNGDGSVTTQKMTSMLVARGNFTASLLPDGRIILAGGRVSETGATDLVEIYDPAGGDAGTGQSTFVPVRLPEPSYGHSAMVSNGKVYLLNGADPFADHERVSHVQIIDPVAGTCSQGTALPQPAFGSGLVDLGNGTGLLAGGLAVGATVVADAYLFEPAGAAGLGSFTGTGSLGVARRLFTELRLADGTVLAVGGASTAGTTAIPLGSAEVFNPGTGSFTTLASALTTARAECRPVQLPDGSVLLIGGITGLDASGQPIFTDATDIFN